MERYPEVGSLWRHHNGNEYTVLMLANTEGDDPTKWDKYPPTVVYRGVNGKIWARPFYRWHSSMTEVVE